MIIANTETKGPLGDSHLGEVSPSVIFVFHLFHPHLFHLVLTYNQCTNMHLCYKVTVGILQLSDLLNLIQTKQLISVIRVRDLEQPARFLRERDYTKQKRNTNNSCNHLYL